MSSAGNSENAAAGATSGNLAGKEAFDPYRVWLSIPKAEQPPNHYRLLGVSLFEADPQVIEEAADRQIAHLKTKQTGKHVALSQQLLQQVAMAAGCLLDDEAKRKYDKKLKKSLALAEAPQPKKPAASEASEPTSTTPIQPAHQMPTPIIHQPTMPYPGNGYPAPGYAPVYAQPGYTPASQAYPQPGYVPAPLPPVQNYVPVQFPQQVVPQQLAPRPIPVAPPAEPPINLPEEPTNLAPRLAGTASMNRGRSHSRSSSSDLVKLMVVGGACLLFVLVGAYLFRSGIFSGAAATVAQAPKSKPDPKVTKTAEQTPVKVTPATPAEIPPATKANPDPNPPSTTESQPVTKPATPADPAVSMLNPATLPGTEPGPMPLPVTPLPLPMPMNTGLTNPLASATPSNTPSANPGAKKLWRHLGGFIEQLPDGTWKELAPSGDYFTLTPLGQGGDTWEFERPVPANEFRIRLFDNRYESAFAPFTQFVEAAKGTWTLPLEEIDLEAQHQYAIKRHCDTYADTIARARKGMLDKFETEMSPNRKLVGKADEWLALLEILKAEKARFETDGLLPWSRPMRGTSAEYLKIINTARTDTDRRLEGIKNGLTQKHQLAAVSSVLALQQKLLAPLVVAKLIPREMPRPAFDPRRLRNNDDESNSHTYRLWSNGHVNDASGSSKWTIDNMGLVLNIVRAGSTSRDQIALSDSGSEFSARSSFGNNYAGVFAGNIEPHERRPEASYNPKPKADPAKPAAAAEAIAE